MSEEKNPTPPADSENEKVGDQPDPVSAAQEVLEKVAEEIAQEVDEVKTLTSDLQRLQADFANYRKRVDKERIEWSERAVELVVAEFIPTLDNLDRAEQHGELTAGFKAVADQIIAITKKLGLERFDDENVAFDPNIHEALLHETSSEVTQTTATKVLQPGYKFKEKVIRPARVTVTDPE